jgi:rhamnulokinase
MTRAVAAVDLGATSGRVMLGYVGPNELRLVPIRRFPNGPLQDGGELHWNVTGLFHEVLDGLADAVRIEPDLVSVGVDSWAVDYGLLRDGELIREPFHYRDGRVTAGIDEVHGRISSEALYARTGIQRLPFNTVYQLATDSLSGRLADADRFLLIPDLVTFWLTGREQAERTNASTTALLDAATGAWDWQLIGDLGLPPALFAPLVDAGSPIGSLLPPIAERLGLRSLEVSAVGSHDTASAVTAVPSTDEHFAYISSGTWSLVGVELEKPVLTEESRLANFTNEGGVDGRVRYLRNVMGLWMLNESVRGWEETGEKIVLADLLKAAAAHPGDAALFDPDDPRFLPPGDMPSRIAEWFTERGLPAPGTRTAIVRSIIESLAEAYARTIHEAVELSGKRVDVVHLLGGGSQNELLCQLTADRSGLPLMAGPAEATAIGNVLIQARAQGIVEGSLESLRSIVASAFPPRKYLPTALSAPKRGQHAAQ